MEAYLLDWANLLLRWLHLIVAIAWIGSSFYFVWLDNHLHAPTDAALKQKGVDGELWAVHGGGFYNPQKYLCTPAQLPQDLHWFYWESYSTWLSGLALFSLVYLFNPSTYLIDPAVAHLTPAAAVVAALAFLVCGWFAYDGLCRLAGRNEKLLALALPGLVLALAWGSCQLFAGRAAFLITGATLATIMSANVFFWIIPGQRKVVAALRAGLAPDPAHGQRGKQRSVHNTYFTLPVLFAMLSNHYSMTYTHRWNWLVLSAIMLAGVLIRRYFVLRHKGHNPLLLPSAAIALLLATGTAIAPRPQPASAAATPVRFAQIHAIVQARCAQCHSSHPSMVEFPAKGLVLDTPQQIQAKAQLIYQQVVQQQQMPLGNLTHITAAERAQIARWVEGGAGIP